MGSKKKCKLCKESMRWALPERVTNISYEYAKRCLNLAKSTLVCGRTMKTKFIEHEQYCKHYHPKDNIELDFETKCELKRIKNLEDMIREYENSLKRLCRQVVERHNPPLVRLKGDKKNICPDFQLI
mgnify:CR=1 FL=1